MCDEPFETDTAKGYHRAMTDDISEKETGKKPFKVGDGTPGPGRPKGVGNKSTKAVKEALDMAFDRIGGVTRLAEWADKEPTEFFKLWVKMLPAETKLIGDADQPVYIQRIERVIIDPKAPK